MVDWLVEIYNKDKGLVGLIVTISIFFLGLIFQALFKFISLEISRMRIRKAYRITISDFKKSLEGQSKELTKARKNFTFENQSDFPYRKFEFLFYKRVYSEGFKNTYGAFFGGIRGLFIRKDRELKIRLFNKIWDSLEASNIAISKFSDEILRINNIYFETNILKNKHLEDLRKNLDNIMLNAPSYFATVGNEFDFYQGIIEIRKRLIEIVNPNHKQIQEIYIEPLIQLMHDYKNRDDAVRMFDYLIPTSQDYMSMKHAMGVMNNACFYNQIYFKREARKVAMFIKSQENTLCISKCLR